MAARARGGVPLIETPDQLTTIDEVKADMEREVPMDRLISGDVGYGKTEVAVRAAFKAVQDGKQVAVLVPTTLLAQQHAETFTERFSGFPVRLAALSRFQTAKETKETLAGLKDGTIDVVIGTHRLLSKEVQFKDLGLVVIDEEQRFGVEHKEKLKAMRTNVDVLAMSATPIPRTLEMSLTGIRETSTLATPPEERHPVLTYVGAYTDKQVSAAVRRELMREGQVFYIHNRVSSIERKAKEIAELVPEARIAVAHGQMSESRLEQIIVDFWEKKFDVLVCTTIVETGLDIANANTLIVDGADRYGLSQLHQLRGRVGRGRERAYAYFLYQAEKPLSETALERLKAVAAHNELGAGMQLAVKDLEIRGAGNLLGGEQSGHIAGVGFDMYLRLVGEAVAEYRGEEDERPTEMKIELPVNAYLPHDYVPGERLRLEAYRNLANAATEEAIQEVADELVDRYGEVPEPVQNLLEVARFRVAARAAGLTDVAAQGNMVRFAPADLPESRQMRLTRLYPGAQIKTVPGTETAQVLIPKPILEIPRCPSDDRRAQFPPPFAQSLHYDLLMMLRQFSIFLPENRRGLGVFGALAGALLSGFLLGCGEPEQIREYTVPKMARGEDSVSRMAEPSQAAGEERMLAAMIPHGRLAWFFKLSGPNEPVENQMAGFFSLIKSVTFSPQGTPEWKLPAKWKSEGQAGMRFATITIPTADSALELSVIPLPMSEGGDNEEYKLENVNRWRGQLGLAPIAKADLKTEVIELNLADSKAMVVNLLGQKPAGMPGQPPFANMRPTPPRAPNTPPARTALQKPAFQVPENWTPAKNDTFSTQAFEMQKDGKKVRITVTPLEPLGETLPLHINRWRRQVGLPPAGPNELDQSVEKIEAGGLSGFYVKLVNQQAILAGILPQAGRTWFIKLIGDAPLALEQEPAFKTFVQSVRFSPNEEAGE